MSEEAAQLYWENVYMTDPAEEYQLTDTDREMVRVYEEEQEEKAQRQAERRHN